MVKIMAIVLGRLTQNNLKKHILRRKDFESQFFYNYGLTFINFLRLTANFLADLRLTVDPIETVD